MLFAVVVKFTGKLCLHLPLMLAWPRSAPFKRQLRKSHHHIRRKWKRHRVPAVCHSRADGALDDSERRCGIPIQRLQLAGDDLVHVGSPVDWQRATYVSFQDSSNS